MVSSFGSYLMFMHSLPLCVLLIQKAFSLNSLKVTNVFFCLSVKNCLLVQDKKLPVVTLLQDWSRLHRQTIHGACNCRQHVCYFCNRLVCLTENNVCLSMLACLGNRQSDEHWNRFRGNVGDISQRQAGARKGISKHTYTILD